MGAVYRDCVHELGGEPGRLRLCPDFSVISNTPEYFGQLRGVETLLGLSEPARMKKFATC
jgi:hypothetical protein